MDARILSVRILIYLHVIVLLVYSLQYDLDSEVICPMYMKNCHKVPRFNASVTKCSCFLGPSSGAVCIDEYTPTSETHELTDIISSTSKTDTIRNIILYTLAYGSCTRLPFFKYTTSRVFTIVDRCPDSANETLKRSCENPLHALPLIIYNGHMDITFKNIHCANCHGASSEYQNQLTPWKFRYNCPDNASSWNAMQLQMSNTSCSLEFNYSPTPHHCNDVKYFEAILAADCNECLKLNTTMQNIFDNEACIVCKVLIDVSSQHCTHAQDPEPNEDLTRLFRLPELQRDELVFINHETFKSSELCADDENFDNLFALCRPFICYAGKMPYRGACVEPTNIYLKSSNKPLNSEILNSGILNVTVTFCQIDSFTMMTFDFIYSHMKVYLKDYILETYKTANVGQFMLNSTNLPLTKFLLLASSRTYDLASVKISLEISNWPTITDEIEECPYSKEMLCYNHTKIHFLKEEMYVGVVSNQKQTLMYPVDSVLYKLRTSNLLYRERKCVKLEYSNMPDPEEENGGNIRNSGSTTSTPHDSLVFTEVCVCADVVDDNDELQLSMKINCSHKLYQYEESEYTLTENGQLLINGISNTYTISEFYIGRNSVAYICFNFSAELAEDLFGFDIVQKYLSWVCTGLSCLFLLLSILFHLLLTEANSTPRKLQLGLYIYLLLAQCLLQLPNLYLGICSYLAALTHFAWLSVFTWMTVLAVHMYFTFGKFALAVKFSFSFTKYLTICTLFPTVVVGICFSLDHIPDSILQVRYGQGSCAWISDLNGLIYFFYVPVAISLTANIFCFCVAMWYMRITVDVSLAEQGHYRNMCTIYIKMSSLMGFTWLFGFIAAFAKTNALWYVYIVLNGLQGCFIFVSFHFNSRTGHLLLTKLKCMTSTSIVLTESTNTKHIGTQNRSPSAN